MQDWLAAQATARPQGICLILEDGQIITFRQLDCIADAAAQRLSSEGIVPNDIVSIWIEDKFLFIVYALAVMRLGAILLPLNLRLTTTEIQWQLQQVGCRNVLVSSPLNLPGDGLQNHIIVNADYAKLPSDFALSRNDEIDLDKPFAVMFTSGTSGQPKAATLTFSNIFYSAMASAYRIGVLPDDCWLCVLPLYHIGGLSIILRSLLYGTSVRLLSQFDVDAVNDLLTSQPITLVSLVPTMLKRLIETQSHRWNDGLRLVLLGGAAPSSELIAACHSRNIPVATTYGLTEAASQVATALPATVLNKPDSVGKPLLFTSFRIANDTGQTLPNGEPGEIYVKGANVFTGYYNNPDATATVLQNGELRTGDIGYLDADGDLHIVNRRSDLIVTGGENVYPAEVEAALRQHPAVADVAVVGIDDEAWGQRVVAAIVLKPTTSATDVEIADFGRQRLAGYKIPRIIRFVATLPQTGSGKIHRAGVRAIFDESHEN